MLKFMSVNSDEYLILSKSMNKIINQYFYEIINVFAVLKLTMSR